MFSRILTFVLASILIAAFTGRSASAQTNGTVEGFVKDAQTGETLPGANVVLAGTSLGASTDANGKYVIRNVPPGSYTLRVTYVGYETMTFPLQLSEGAAIKQDFKLVAVAVQGETVVVTGQAAGQNEAINRQLSAAQITNVVSSARIQELPDANAAESVGRLPGISVLRSGGEGNQIVIRGLQPKYNAITVDGVRMASSDPNNRSVDLSMISPYSLEGIEVTKAVTADQDADVLGGTVNFKMREAKVGQEGLGVSLLFQGGYNGLSNAANKYNNYKYVGSVDGRFFEDLFGVFAQVDLERRNLSSNEFGGSYTNQGRVLTEYLTSGINLNDFLRDRRRANGSLVLDYRLPDGKISLSNFFSSGSTEIRNRGEFYNTTFSNLHNYTLASSSSTTHLITNALNVEQQFPVFHAVLGLSHTYSETLNPDDWTVGFQQTPGIPSGLLNKSNLYPQQIVQAATVDQNATFLTSLLSNNSFSRERALTASLDLDMPVNVSDLVSAVIKFGGKYRYQTRSYDYNQYTGQGLGLQSARFVDSLITTHFPATAQYANTVQVPIGPFMDPNFSYGKFLQGDYAMGFPLNYGMIAEMARWVRSNADLIDANGRLAYFHDNFNSTTNNYDGHENLSAFYVMTTINIGPEITIIPGVRYQGLTTTYTAPRGEQNTSSALGLAYKHYDTTVTVDHSYWLPDIMLRYKPLPWFDVRLSYTNTIAYPDYNSITPRIDRQIGNTITWNNFNLNPSRSTNYDAYVSFYDNSIGLLTVGGFLKRITDLIYPWNFYVLDSNAAPYLAYPPAPGLPLTGAYNIVTFVNDRYRIDDWGMEIDWQTHFWYLPHPFDGLVLNVNYTHIFSKAEYPYTDVQAARFQPTRYVDTSYTDRLLYQPNDIVNLALGYDYEGFSIRVSMLYQADVFTGPSYWPQLRTHTSAYTRWDLSVKQSLPWFGLQVYGDVNNINGTDDVSIINAPTGVPQTQQSYGLTADLGVRIRF